MHVVRQWNTSASTHANSGGMGSRLPHPRSHHKLHRMIRSPLPFAALALGVACGGANESQEPTFPTANEVEAPAWTHPSATPTATSMTPPRETVRIETPAEPDPVGRLLRRSQRRVKNLSLHQAPLDDTLRMLADMGRFNVVIVSEVGSRKVSVDLKDVSLEGAFGAVLASAHLEARWLADDIVEVRGAGAR
jgi:hypothetical protein